MRAADRQAEPGAPEGCSRSRQGAEREAREHARERERERDGVGRLAHRVAPSQGRELARREVTREQVGSARVAPEREERERERQERGGVDRCRRLLVAGAAVAQVLGDERRRERHERDPHQQQQVDQVERPIDPREAVELGVVVEPDDPDCEKAREEREVRRPKLGECMPEAVLSRVGHLELEDQQRDRDREDAVAERLDAALARREPYRLRDLRGSPATAGSVIVKHVLRPGTTRRRDCEVREPATFPSSIESDPGI